MELTFKEIENRMSTPCGAIHIVWNSWPSHRNVRSFISISTTVIINPISIPLEEIS
jgi:hypothetical protein